jgi:hypothetical protein
MDQGWIGLSLQASVRKSGMKWEVGSITALNLAIFPEYSSWLQNVLSSTAMPHLSQLFFSLSPHIIRVCQASLVLSSTWCFSYCLTRLLLTSSALANTLVVNDRRHAKDSGVATIPARAISPVESDISVCPGPLFGGVMFNAAHCQWHHPGIVVIW